MIFLNLRLPSSSTFARPYKQACFWQIHASTIESHQFIVNVLIKRLKLNLVCVCFFWLLAENVQLSDSLKTNDKLINAKSNREPGMEGAGKKSGLGFMFREHKIM